MKKLLLGVALLMSQASFASTTTDEVKSYIDGHFDGKVSFEVAQEKALNAFLDLFKQGNQAETREEILQIRTERKAISLQLDRLELSRLK